MAKELKIEEDVKIERAHRTGKVLQEKDKRKGRTLIVKFLDYKDKLRILDKYRNVMLWNKNLYINEDFSRRTSEIIKKLFAEAKELRPKGYIAKVVYKSLIKFKGKQL